jgi:DNA-binding transcriptional regulator LsrR (DeoR family)
MSTRSRSRRGQIGPAQLVLMASVARRYFLDGRSKIEIADEFQLSRFKIARLLDASRETGMVQIEIRHQGAIDVDLSARLQERFDLTHAIVVDTPDEDVESLRRHLGRAAGELLGEVCTAQDVRTRGPTMRRCPGAFSLSAARARHESSSTGRNIVRVAL